MTDEVTKRLDELELRFTKIEAAIAALDRRLPAAAAPPPKTAHRAYDPTEGMSMGRDAIAAMARVGTDPQVIAKELRHSVMESYDKS
jgi:hypothetical protein